MRFQKAPRLETDRLILRPHEARDHAAFTKLWQDPAVLKHTIVEPRSAQDAWMTMQRQLGSWPLLGYGFWAIAWGETDQFIGDAGFMDAFRDETVDKRGVPEVGYALSTPYHGRGLISEALAAMHGWLDRERPGTETFALIDDDNQASIRVAQKFGYVAERRHDSEERKGALYTRKPLPLAPEAD